MKLGLSGLAGRVVRTVVAEHGLHLHFDDGTSLSVFNAASWSGPSGEKLSSINGRRVTEAQELEEDAQLAFDDGSVLEIDLRDSSFIDAEAMILRIPGAPIVVWNRSCDPTCLTDSTGAAAWRPDHGGQDGPAARPSRPAYRCASRRAARHSGIAGSPCTSTSCRQSLASSRLPANNAPSPR